MFARREEIILDQNAKIGTSGGPHRPPLRVGARLSRRARGTNATNLPLTTSHSRPMLPLACASGFNSMLRALLHQSLPQGASKPVVNALPKPLCVNDLHQQSTNCTKRQNAGAVQ